jgi:hypothetical protein
MGVLHWFEQNGSVLLQNVGIIGGLIFTALSLRIDASVRRVSNLMTLTHYHRDIWTRLYTRPELSRVLKEKPNLERFPINHAEELFVTLLILHLNTAYEAMKHRMFVQPEGLRRDIISFFSLPIPKTVWENNKQLQNKDFVRFVESCLRRH